MPPHRFSRTFTRDQPGRLTHDELESAVLENKGPVEVAFATIGGPIDLSSIRSGHRLSIRDSTFEGPVDLSDADFRHTVDLTGSTFGGNLNLSGARVEGSLLLDGATIRRDRADPARSARFDLARVQGDLLARGMRAGVTLDFSQAEVRGRLDLSATKGRATVVAGSLVLRGLRAGGNVGCQGARIRGDLDVNSASLRADFAGGCLREPPDSDDGPVVRTAFVGGRARFVASRIGGELDLSGTMIRKMLNLQTSEVRSGLFCRCVQGHRPAVRGDILARAARFSATADFSGIDVAGDLLLDFAVVEGVLFLYSGQFCPDGPPRAEPGAPEAPPPDLPSRIGGSLAMPAMKIEGAFQASGLRVGGQLVLQGAAITGMADLTAARVGFAPAAEPVPWPADAGPVADDSIFARGARIGGHLSLAAASIRGRVDLRGARLDGGVSALPFPVDLPPGQLPPAQRDFPRFGGTASLAGARVRGEADFRFATIDGELHLDGIVVDGKLRCRLLEAPGAAPGDATRVAALSLRSSSVRHIDLEGSEENEPRPPGGDGPAGQDIPIHLDGATFRDLTVPADDYLMLFRNTGSGYRRSSYITVERWLRGHGEEALAVAVHRTMRKHRRERGKMGPFAQLGDLFIGGLQALARRFVWLALAWLVLVAATAFLFADPGSIEPKGETKAEPAARPWAAADAIWMAVQLNLPIVDLPVGAKWEASGRRVRAFGATPGPRYDQCATFITLVSYIVVPLIITGIVRNWLEQRSGDD